MASRVKPSTDSAGGKCLDAGRRRTAPKVKVVARKVPTQTLPANKTSSVTAGNTMSSSPPAKGAVISSAEASCSAASISTTASAAIPAATAAPQARQTRRKRNMPAVEVEGRVRKALKTTRECRSAKGSANFEQEGKKDADHKESKAFNCTSASSTIATKPDGCSKGSKATNQSSASGASSSDTVATHDSSSSSCDRAALLDQFARRLRQRETLWHQTLVDESTPGDRQTYLSGKMKFYYTNSYLMNFLKQSRENVPDASYWTALQNSCPSPLNGALRQTIVAWMMHTHNSIGYPLSRQTLHIAISLFDRFFSAVVKGSSNVPKMIDRSVHAIASACFYLASKLEDGRPIGIDECTRIIRSDNGHPSPFKDVSPNDILNWELSVLRVLDFNVNVPTALDFLAIFLHADSRLLSDIETPSDPGSLPCSLPREVSSRRTSYEACAAYLTELTMLFPEAVQIPAHVIAAVSLCCAITYIDRRPRRITNLPEKVLVWLEKERSAGVLKDAAAKIATILDVHAECRDDDNGKQADEKHKEASSFFLAVYRRWKSDRCGVSSELAAAALSENQNANRH